MGFAESFRALSDPIRREILTQLRGGRLSAGEIGGHFDLTGAAISYHLNQLKRAGLVYEEKYKNFVYYGLNTSVMEEMVLWLKQFDGGKHNEKSEDSLLCDANPATGGDADCPGGTA